MSASAHTPTVDIVVPCRNYGHFLDACVNSALNQEGVNLRVTIVDDASTDSSVAVAESLARKDARVRVISLKQNVGVINAVNLALRDVDATYFVKLDADDLLSPGSLRRSVELLERHPNVGFVYGRVRHFYDDDLPLHAWGPRPTLGFLAEWLVVRGVPYSTVWSGEDWLALRCKNTTNCISQPEAVIRTACLRKVGGSFNVALSHTYDFDMWLRLAAVSDVARINLADQGFYRVHANSMQRTVNAGVLTDLIGRRAAFSTALSTMLPARRDLDEAFRQNIASIALRKACDIYDAAENRGLTDELVDFAFATYASAASLPEWQKLQRLRRETQRRLAWHARLNSFLRPCREKIAYAKWFRTGE